MTSGEIPPPVPPPPRWTDPPLPAYRYVPGHAPHPFRHPAGHGYVDGSSVEAPSWTLGPWWADQTFLYGVDLFNHRYLWEAHEVWEGAWRQMRPEAAERSLLQGLIQVAAAWIKRHLGHPDPGERLLRRGLEHLAEAQRRGGGLVHGVHLDRLCEAVGAAWEDGAWPVLRLEAAVGHPQTTGGGVAIRVVAAAIVREGRVFAARRRESLARGGLWELPGGKVEPGESDAAALQRELLEELGLEVEVHEHLASAVHDYGDVCIQLVAYRCAGAGAPAALHDHDEVAWLSEGELASVPWAPADVPLLEAVAACLRGG